MLPKNQIPKVSSSSVSCTIHAPKGSMLLHAFQALSLLCPHADRIRSIGESFSREGFLETLPSSLGLISVSVHLGMNNPNIQIVDQNGAGQMEVN